MAHLSVSHAANADADEPVLLLTTSRGVLAALKNCDHDSHIPNWLQQT
jgi:hypothetical protein